MPLSHFWKMCFRAGFSYMELKWKHVIHFSSKCKMDLKTATVMNRLYMGFSPHSSHSWNCLGERHLFYGPLIQFNHVQTSESWHLYNGVHCPSYKVFSNVNAMPLHLELLFCWCHPIPGVCFTSLFIWKLHKGIVALLLVVWDKSVGALYL